MKRLILIVLILLLAACPALGKVYTTHIGADWHIDGADLSNCTGLTGNTWIETLIRLPGDIFYVDSNASGEADGSSWTDAVTTIDAAVNLCTNDNGDLIFVAPGHTETLGTGANGVDADIRGISIIGVGVGENRPMLDYDTTTDEFVIGADDVTIANLTFKSNIDSVAHAIDIEAGAENYSIVDCRFYLETTGTDDFDDVIISNAGCDNGLIENCDIEMGAGADNQSAINIIGSDYLIIRNNRISGDFAVANIEDSGTASIWLVIEDNILVNGTVGGAAGLNTLPVITLKVDTAAVIVNNTCITNVATSDLAIVAADGYLAGNTYNETEGGLANATPIGLIAGREYSTTWDEATFANDDAWIVAGGPIMITSLTGIITTEYDGQCDHTWLINAETAAQDREFTDSVDINAYLVGSILVYTAANPALITQLQAGTNKGTGNLMLPWFCPIGTLELLIENNAASNGAITWYMTYIPLVEGVTVTPQ